MLVERDQAEGTATCLLSLPSALALWKYQGPILPFPEACNNTKGNGIGAAEN